MASENIIKIITYNVHGGFSLGNLYIILEVYKPGLVLLQEVKLSSEQLAAFGRRLGYTGASNIDELEPSKPGTGILWHTSLPVSQVVPLYPCRIQLCMLGAYPVMNCYVPAGSHRAAERRHFFVEQMFGLLAGQEDILPICGGDWNCVTEKIDLQHDRYFNDRKSQDLTNIIREFGLVDAFRHLRGRAREYTWQGRDGASASRLDRFYVPPCLSDKLVSMTHHVGYSDHKLGLLEINLAQITRLPKQVRFGSGYWKLNNKVLLDQDFMLNFNKLWDELVVDQGNYVDKADWWDLMFKPELRTFLQHFSATRARTRKQLKELLCEMLDRAQGEGRVGDVAMARGRLQSMMYEDNMGFIIRSRFKENSEVEKASLFHSNREKKFAQVGNLEKLFINGKVETDKKNVEKVVTQFFGNLLSGKHGPNGVEQEHAFEPDFGDLHEFLEDLAQLSPESRAAVEEPVNIHELEIVLEQSDNNRSPGEDGLSYEMYKAVKETVADTMVEVMNCQLERVKLMLSGTQGVTRLTSKTEPGVVPRVDQLRPITLLNTDYKLLTAILSNRLIKIMHEIIKSGQLCSVKGANIHFGTHNIISALSYLEEKVLHAEEAYGYKSEVAGGAVLVSYDLFKAYDRVSLPYLERVMAKMGFGPKFISWIHMLHADITTRFILNFLTDPVKVLISIRQGDPIAMVLFIIYMEPLLMMIKKHTSGLKVMGISQWSRNPHNLYRGEGSVCVKQEEVAYVDDVNLLLEKPEEMVVVDAIFSRFERVSGAILNRSEKTKCMGLGHWEGRQRWPLPWIKVEKSLKIFGITHCPSYKQTLEFNWKKGVEKFVSCLNSWNTRVLNSVFQRAEVLNVFALPKLYYLAECLPLPDSFATEFDSHVFKFLKMGKLEMPPLQELYAPVDQGGLGLVMLRAKADSLFLKQTLRMMSQPKTTFHDYIKFFVGNKLMTHEFHGYHHHTVTPYYEHMLSLFKEAEIMELCHVCCCVDCVGPDCKERNLKTTAKEIYSAYTDSLPPPKVEYKPEYANVSSMMWGRVWSRVASPMLDPMSRQTVWRLINDVLPTRQRYWRMRILERDNRQVIHPECNRCNLREVDTVGHMFTACVLVREAWCWVRRRLLEMLPDDMADLSNVELINMMFPRENRENEMVWLVGMYLSWAFEEAVLKGRVLNDQHVKAYMQYMAFQTRGMNMPQLGHISGITVSQNQVFDNG